MTRAAVADLYDLQELDLDIDRRSAERELQRRNLDEDVVRPARETLSRARRQAERARAEAQTAEAALHEAEARIQRHEQRLYGGGTGARDLSALQTELAHLRAAHAEQEDRALAVMLAAEEAEAAEHAAREALQVAERDEQTRRGQLRTSLADADARLAELRAQRETRAATIPVDVLGRYETIRRTHGGRGIALVQAGTCQACRVVVSSGTLQRARAASELVPCTNCGRLLFVR